MGKKSVDACFINQQIVSIDFDDDYGTLILANGEKLYSMDLEYTNIYVGAIIEQVLYEEEMTYIILSNGEKLEVELYHEDLEEINHPGLVVDLRNILDEMLKKYPKVSIKDLALEVTDVKDTFEALVGKWFKFMGKKCLALGIADYNELEIRILIGDDKIKIVHIASLR